MTKSILPAALSAIALLAAAPALAQDATPAPAETPPAATAPEGLNMGVTLDENGNPIVEVGQPYIRQAFDDWAMRCIKTPEDTPEPCQLFQLLTDESGAPMAEFTVVPLPPESEARALINIVAPLGTLLAAPLTLQVDSGPVRAYPTPFLVCDLDGCLAQIGISQADVDGLKAGNGGKLTLVPASSPDTPVELAISLAGFTAAFDARSE